MIGPTLLGVLLLAAAPTDDLPAAGIPIRVALPACDAQPWSFAAFVDALRVELAGAGRICCETGPGDGQPAVEVTLSAAACDAGSANVGVAITNPTVAMRTERYVSLADLPPDARPRALALAVAEMVRASEQRPPAETPPVPPSEIAAPAAATGAGFGGALAAELRLHGSSRTALFGFRLAPFLTGGRWRAGFEIAAASAGADRASGHVALRLLTAGVSAGPRWQFGGLAIGVGFAGELGAGFVVGTPAPGATGDRGTGLVATAGVRAELEAPAGAALRFRAVLQAGETLHGVTGDVDGVTVIGAIGPFLLLGLGASI
jgi:hypothetical protein